MQKKLKILHLNASSGGGAFVVAQRLSEALNKTGEVESSHLVFTGKPGNYHLWSSDFWHKKYAFFLHALEKLDFLRFEKNKSVRFAFSHGKTGINILKNKWVNEADIIHLHWINKGFVSLNGLEKLLGSGKPVVWTCHDQWPFTGGCYYSGKCDHYLNGCGNCPMLINPSENDLSHKVFQRKKNILSKKNNLTFITPSQWLADIGRASGTAKGKVINTIPNGIDTSLFSPDNRNELRNKKGFNTDKYVILFAAVNISDRRKGFSEFEELIRLLAVRFPGKLEIIYIGENKGNIPHIADTTEHFTGYISDPGIMADWYRCADLYVTTSNDDNLPTTIMESLACGTPVGAFRVGGIPEMVEHNITGVLSEVYEVAALADAIIGQINRNVSQTAEMRENARIKAVKEYSLEIVTQKHIDLYHKVSKTD